MTAGPKFFQAGTIDEAVQLALAQAGDGAPGAMPGEESFSPARIEAEIRGWLPGQRYLRGLFAGGTFCYQAQQVLSAAGIPVYSNTPLDRRYQLENPEESLEHSLIDLGDDHFTRGKPHPMIDASQRRRRILAEAADPEVAVLLLDFILGAIASPDPAGDLVEAIREAKEMAARRGGRLTVVASICGTGQDPQGLDRQKALLAGAGVIVFPSNARAACFCRDLILSMPGGQDGR